MKIRICAICAFGLETLVRFEFERFGLLNISVSDGRVDADGSMVDIVRLNLWSRFADRVLIVTGEFTAVTFDGLFEGIRGIPWEEWIDRNGNFPVEGKSVRSTLHHLPSCQAIVKKAVAERLNHGSGERLPETGPERRIRFSILKDRVTVAIDTSGESLHRRGYRLAGGTAPLKETIAAAMVYLSGWQGDIPLLDPCCGSGTIAVEAAMAALNIAPGCRRSFAAEKWPVFPSELWRDGRMEAREQAKSKELCVQASDIDPGAVALAQSNAVRAGVSDSIRFETKDLNQIWIDREFGTALCNPPYGERLEGKSAAVHFLHVLGKIFRKKSGWNLLVLTPEDGFERIFGRPADRRRKLYNGRIKVDLFQYFGKVPAVSR
ncbi:MAG: class I SAM-dependent RNA methyltransferase [Candidatus Wallbacteria bacterium]|nr:class I SAM-dependent RNA methyltransferase [Candidatus Wallbacteria bacterium]